MEDKLNQQNREKLETMQRKLKNGELTSSEISDLLEIEIYNELSKPAHDVDNEWLDTCSKMMEDADRDQVDRLPDHKEQNWQVICKKMKKKSAPHFSRMRFKVALACTTVVLFGLSFSFGWYQGAKQKDGQTYELTGGKIELSNAQNASADADTSVQEIETTELAEIIEFLGVEPPMPSYVPDGWQAGPFCATISAEYLGFSSYYSNPDYDTKLSYTCIFSSDKSAFSESFQQNGEVGAITFESCSNIYVVSNSDDTFEIWQDDSMLVHIVGPISQEESTQMLYSIHEDDCL